MRYRCLLPQMRQNNNVNVIFLSDASSLSVQNKVKRYYLTSKFIKYYDYNLWEIVLVTNAIGPTIVDGQCAGA